MVLFDIACVSVHFDPLPLCKKDMLPYTLDLNKYTYIPPGMTLPHITRSSGSECNGAGGFLIQPA